MDVRFFHLYCSLHTTLFPAIAVQNNLFTTVLCKCASHYKTYTTQCTGIILLKQTQCMQHISGRVLTSAPNHRGPAVGKMESDFYCKWTLRISWKGLDGVPTTVAKSSTVYGGDCLGTLSLTGNGVFGALAFCGIFGGSTLPVGP